MNGLFHTIRDLTPLQYTKLHHQINKSKVLAINLPKGRYETPHTAKWGARLLIACGQDLGSDTNGALAQIKTVLQLT